jgi:undecaprenyl-diphosphatase
VKEYFEAVVLGVLQGLTEFLPISSSAHLRIFPAFFGWDDPGAGFTAVIQIGTELAVLIYFAKDIWRIGDAWLRSLWQPQWRGHPDARMGWYVIIGSLPIVVLGVSLKDTIENEFRSLWIIGTTLVVMGVVLGVADRVGSTQRLIGDLTMRHAVLYGAAQALALIPGVSRSGATISMGRFLGYEREAATRFAFLLAIPAVVGAGIFQLQEVIGCDPGSAAEACASNYGPMPTLVATIVSFFVGYSAIAWLLRYVSTHSFLPFVIYRIALGSLTLGLVATGALAA